MVGTDGSRLRVAGDTRDIVAGKAMAFDDSFEHEAWHDGVETRITLIVDIWHPDLTDREVKFLGHLQVGCTLFVPNTVELSGLPIYNVCEMDLWLIPEHFHDGSRGADRCLL